VRVHVPSGPTQSFAIFPEADRDLPRVDLAARDAAVLYPSPRTIECSTLVRGVARPVELPAAASREGEGWSMRWTFEPEADELRATWTLRLDRRRFDPAAFDELRRMWAAMRRATSVAVPFTALAEP
jgi:hypothetical protein